MLDLSGRTALVTGGARGVGSSVVDMLARQGAHVVVNSFHSYDRAKETQARLRGQGHRVDVIRASVAKQAQVDRMFDEVRERWGRLDILVNNAAAGTLGPVADTTAEDFAKALDTNVLGSFWCARRAVELMPTGSAIVNVSSIGATLTPENYLSVGTSKAALEAVTRFLAAEYAPRGIRVNTASCSLIDGDVARMFPRYEEMRRATLAATPLGRTATAEDLARIVLFLVSELSGYLTGQTILADGGLSLGAIMLSPPRAAVDDRAPTPEAAPEEQADVRVEDAAPESIGADDPIAVVGMGLALPGANSPEELWRRRLDGPPVFSEVPVDRWRVESFHDTDPAAPDKTYSRWSGFITGFEPHPGDPANGDAVRPEDDEYTTRWLRHAVRQALDGVRRAGTDRFSCFVGYTADGSHHLEEALVLAGLRRRLDRLEGPRDGRLDRVRSRVEAHLHRAGPEPSRFLPHEVGRRAVTGVLPPEAGLLMVDTACSSSLYTVDLGIKALRQGDCDIAVCGGAFALGPRGSVLFSKLGGLARSGGVRSLDRSGDGVLFSDGAGVVVLKRLSRALADGDEVLGLLAGVGTSSDGKGKAIYAPSPAGQAIAVRRALAAPGVDADRIDWVAAHATGTPAGDLAELNALRDALPADRPIQVTSNKSVIGHSGWAAGVASLIEVLLALRHETIPPQLAFDAPPEGFDVATSALRIPKGAVPWPAVVERPRCASVSSFGFGGTNAHVVVEDFQAQRPAPGAGPEPQERIAVIGWTAHLPGLAAVDDVAAWLNGTGPAPGHSFGPIYPAPSFRDVRLPGRTVRTLDRCQLMVLECMNKLEPMLGEVWRAHRETTGVLAGHMGPTRNGTLYALRCHLDDVRTLLVGEAAAAELLDDLEADLRRLVPESNEDSFPGIMPNVIPARVANYFDFHGLNMTVDAGFESTSGALDVASRYLRAGDLDLALVFGVNGNSTDELAEVVSSLLPSPRRIAEGAFQFALTRAGTAAEWGVTPLGWLDELTSDPTGASGTAGAASYLGADGAVELARALARRHLPAEPAARPPAPHAGPEPTAPAPPGPVPAARSEAAPSLDVARHVVTLSPVPLVPVQPPAELLPPGSVLLTDRPELFADRELDGVTVLCTAPVDRPGWTYLPRVDPGTVAAALPDPSSVRHLRVVTDLERGAPPDRPWDASPGLTALHDLTFLVIQHGYDTFSRHGSLVLLALSGRPDGSWHPYAGMFTGLVKSVALEVPDLVVVAVVSSTGDLATGLAQATAEASAHQFLPVVVYDGDLRQSVFAEESDDAGHVPGHEPLLSADSVVVACGGARGITAELLKAVARRARPVIYVLGSNPIDDHPADLMDRTDEEFAAGRVAFLRDQLARRPDVAIARLNAEYDRVGHARTARRNLAEMTEASGTGRVHYLRCDVRDRDQVNATMAEILRRERRIDLLLNAAGTNRSAAIPTKRWADFRSVRDIKIATYANLRYALRDHPPRLWCNFGSFVGFTGQVGEVDYASANDFLFTAASRTAEVTGRDELTIGWTLWRETGLGAGAVTKAFLEKSGLFTSMKSAEGVHHFLRELDRHTRRPAVVHLGDTEKRAIEAHMPGYFDVLADHAGERSRPFYLETARRHRSGQLWAERTFDLTRDPYLAHHVVAGHPTLPGTFVPEIAAQAASELVPGRVPAVFQDAVFTSFLRIYGGNRPAVKKIHARVLAEDERETVVHVRVLTDVQAPNGLLLATDKVHFEVTVRMRDELPAAPVWEPWPDAEDECPIPDPYHLPNPAVHLTGPFVSTTDTRLHRLGRRARLSLRVPSGDPVFSRFVVPSILLDGLARTCVLEPVGGDWLPLAAPARMRRIDLYERGNDCELAAAHPAIELYSLPRGLDLRAPEPDNRCLAVGSGGRVLLQIKDVTGVVLGHVHRETGEFRPPRGVAGGEQPAATAAGAVSAVLAVSAVNGGRA